MQAKENFIRSCAGYFVIAYVLGIEDRNTTNVKVAPSGHLFYIDLDTFFGYKQKKDLKD